MMQMPETIVQTPLDQPEPLPFPYNQSTYCRYERIEQRIETVRTLVVNTLLHDERDLSDVARREGARTPRRTSRASDTFRSRAQQHRRQRHPAVREPVTRQVHLSEVTEAAAEFRPQAIVLSGTLSDFDYYDPEMLKRFAEFIRTTNIPVLGICGDTSSSASASARTARRSTTRSRASGAPTASSSTSTASSGSPTRTTRSLRASTTATQDSGRTTRPRAASCASGRTTASNSTACPKASTSSRPPSRAATR